MRKGIDADLLSAIFRNHAVLANALLKSGVDCNATDAHGVSPLHFVAESYSVDVARILLEHGANVDAQDFHGNTPLARAVYRSKGGTQLDLIKLLLSQGADPNIKNNSGESARDLAGRNPQLKKLLDR